MFLGPSRHQKEEAFIPDLKTRGFLPRSCKAIILCDGHRVKKVYPDHQTIKEHFIEITSCVSIGEGLTCANNEPIVKCESGKRSLRSYKIAE